MTRWAKVTMETTESTIDSRVGQIDQLILLYGLLAMSVLAAGILPARRASKLDVLDTIASG